MAYPSAKVHRRSRRKLGRGQYPVGSLITSAFSSPTTTGIVLTFSDAVNVRGRVGLVFSDATTIATQVLTSPTVVTFTFGGSPNTSTTVTLPSNPTNVMGQRGQPITGATATL